MREHERFAGKDTIVRSIEATRKFKIHSIKPSTEAVYRDVIELLESGYVLRRSDLIEICNSRGVHAGIGGNILADMERGVFTKRTKIPVRIVSTRNGRFVLDARLTEADVDLRERLEGDY